MKTIVVGGVIANKYLNGGAVWTRLNWLLGLRKLGYQVYFIEQILPQHCIDHMGRTTQFDQSANLRFLKEVMEEFGLEKSYALVLGEGEQTSGLSMREISSLAAEADAVVNITGHIRLPSIMDSRARKIYVDLDPGYTQYWHQMGLLDSTFAKHDCYFTVGEAIGSPQCSIPTGNIMWQITRQPVVLNLWPVASTGVASRFTSVGSWRDNYGTLEIDGLQLGLKVHEFRKFIEFPSRVSQVCELALDIHSAEVADIELLQANGWVIKDPRKVVPDPKTFREYIQWSGAEFSVAKGIYSQTRSGWFSDRTVRYLASGKPVLVQDTGFTSQYPVGSGLLAFSTFEQAISGAREIDRNYSDHCLAARQLAESWFDSDSVLKDLLERAGVPG